jgi:hypothetical protein
VDVIPVTAMAGGIAQVPPSVPADPADYA